MEEIFECTNGFWSKFKVGQLEIFPFQRLSAVLSTMAGTRSTTVCLITMLHFKQNATACQMPKLLRLYSYSVSYSVALSMAQRKQTAKRLASLPLGRD